LPLATTRRSAGSRAQADQPPKAGAPHGPPGLSACCQDRLVTHRPPGRREARAHCKTEERPAPRLGPGPLLPGRCAGRAGGSLPGLRAPRGHPPAVPYELYPSIRKERPPRPSGHRPRIAPEAGHAGAGLHAAPCRGRTAVHRRSSMATGGLHAAPYPGRTAVPRRSSTAKRRAGAGSDRTQRRAARDRFPHCANANP
jgi:hypothetical protein